MIVDFPILGFELPYLTQDSRPHDLFDLRFRVFLNLTQFRSVTSIDVDHVTTRFALDVTAPMELTITSLSNRHFERLIASAAAHEGAALCTVTPRLTAPVHGPQRASFYVWQAVIGRVV